MPAPIPCSLHRKVGGLEHPEAEAPRLSDVPCRVHAGEEAACSGIARERAVVEQDCSECV